MRDDYVTIQANACTLTQAYAKIVKKIVFLELLQKLRFFNVRTI